MSLVQQAIPVNVFGSDITQLCQAIVNAGVGAGDSGSPVFSGSSNVALYGILWGGNFAGSSFVYSPLNNIPAGAGCPGDLFDRLLI
jgi:hypothetical protein